MLECSYGGCQFALKIIIVNYYQLLTTIMNYYD